MAGTPDAIAGLTANLHRAQRHIRLLWAAVILLPALLLCAVVIGQRRNSHLLRTHSLFTSALVIQIPDNRFHHAALAAGKDGTALSFDDNDDHYRLGLGVGADGSPHLSFFDAGGRKCAEVRVDERGNGIFETFDRTGKLLWRSPDAANR